MRRWFRHFGFPILVLTALAVSGYLAASAPVPDPVPAFALQAGAVYRLEVGGASFTVLYLLAMAFVLALAGRGFAEIGTKGLRATEVVRAADKEQAVLIAERLALIESAIQTTAEQLNEQEKRLARLEGRV